MVQTPRRRNWVAVVVVVVLIGAVVGAAAWGFWSAREKARAVACLSSLKEAGMALRMYAADNDDVLPATRDPDELRPLLAPHMGECLQCLSDPQPGAYDEVMSYDWNAVLAGQDINTPPGSTWAFRDHEPWHFGERNVVYLDCTVTYPR